jgi:predicted nuclease with TOPRIM domain
MNAAWRRAFIEAVAAFLGEISLQSIPVGHMVELREDEQIRQLCQNLTVRQRLKTYRQLYALGCRSDSVDRAIERLNRPLG